MFVNESIDEMLNKLDNPKLVYYSYAPGVSVGEALKHPKEEFQFWINLPNKPMIELCTTMNRIGLYFLYETVAELVGNASRHGNKNSIQDAPNGDPLKSLSIKIFRGKNGVLFRVRNEGEGFDYYEMLREFKENTQSRNFSQGNGTRILSYPDFEVSYEDKGRASNLLFFF